MHKQHTSFRPSVRALAIALLALWALPVAVDAAGLGRINVLSR